MANRVVVVTGSTRGIGRGLADAFLTQGCDVVVSARGADQVTATVSELGQKFGQARVFGKPCDVSRREDVQALFQASKDRFGKVDIWINNAGTGDKQLPFTEQKPEMVATVVQTNLLGAVVATKVALEEMKKQGFGAIYNMLGFGADGKMKRTGFAVYGATKVGTRYFTESIADENADGPVLICTMEPGVVATDLLVSQFDGVKKDVWDKSRKIYSIIGDHVETVAPWLAQRVLANKKNGAHIGYFSVPRMLYRFVSPSYRKRDLFTNMAPPKTV